MGLVMMTDDNDYRSMMTDRPTCGSMHSTLALGKCRCYITHTDICTHFVMHSGGFHAVIYYVPAAELCMLVIFGQLCTCMIIVTIKAGEMI